MALGTDDKAWRRPERFFKAYIFDLDGTVYLEETLLPSAGKCIARLRALGARTLFLSNNPTHSRQVYAARLTRLGLPTPDEDVINSSAVMVHFLRQRMPGARLFVIGEESLCLELEAAGFELTKEAALVDAVIASFDRTFAYWKLQIAFDAIRAGARFFATNGDRYCPVPGGGEPDAAAMIAAVEACTDTKVEVVVGKPSRHMAGAALARVGVPAAECIMIGDRLETDVKMGHAAGMSTALVLTGATTARELASSTLHPDYVLQHLADLLPAGR